MGTAYPEFDESLSSGHAPTRHRLHVRLSAATTAVLLCVAWTLPGLVGHQPWKPDEAAAIGIVHNLLSGNGTWVVPMLAGEAALDTPPLLYLVAAIFAKVFSSLLPMHDAARLAAGVFMVVTFCCLALAAKELYGRDYAGITVIALLGCVGLVVRGHQLIPDLPLLSGFSLGLYGLAIAPRRPLLAGITFGTGIGVGFLARGLLSPLVLIIIAIAVGAHSRPWRKPQFLATLGIGALAAAPWLIIWPLALYRQSPDLFHTWRSQDMIGAHLVSPMSTHAASWHEYLGLLPWHAWPVFPLALWTLLQSRRALRQRPDLQLPLIAFLVMITILGATAHASDVYALPLLLPLTLLAVASLDTLRRGAISALDWFGIMTFGLIAILLWVAWVALVSGWPSGILRKLAAFQPQFQGQFSWLPFLVAALSTFLWVALVARTMPTTRRAIVNWGGGITLMWILASTLWLPYVDAGKSYQGVVGELARTLPKGFRCISSIGLGDSQRAMLEYYAGIVTHREESASPRQDCDVMLTQGTVTQEPAVGAGWKKIWEGARPGDTKERFRLYKRATPKKT